ncbi:hypothetical protein [Aeromonas schubertii]|uniref:Uncharacterized protein n=1 Tax=Aeromonas schubertii TaxID=652 RepID=A0A0S2SEM8_9GAMM|nr:hypothetical protein [Aeromonas schubertii]ALP40098.1 hypothetical protein WL1483_679 [Aeromonas schubertii]MBZ6065306.1 hypothetical protein [Aeromonas schubertii]MBZ6072438.1 hypothetical protein [Aeromonas schubertii]
MEQYQSWLGDYLLSRRDGDHAMAADLARDIEAFWAEQGNKEEKEKWRSRYRQHLAQAV